MTDSLSQTGVAALARRTAFTPATIEPPEKPLGLLRALWSFYTNPIRFWPRALYREPAMINDYAGRRYVNAACPTIARAVLLDEADAFERSRIINPVLRRALGDGLLTTDGAQWRRQRRIAAPSFRRQEILAFTPAMAAAGERAAERLVAQAAAGSAQIDVLPEMVRATFEVITDAVLQTQGFEFDKRAVERDTAVFLNSMGRLDPLDIFSAPESWPRPWKARGGAAIRRIRAVVSDIVAEARRRGVEDDGLTARLLRASDPDEAGAALSDAEVVDNVMTFLGAGHETTALALTWTLFLLSEAQELQEAAAAEIVAAAGDGPITAEHLADAPLIERVLKEALRLYPPVPAIPRSVVRPVRVGDIDLKPGDHISVVTYVMHRHEALWEAPNRFDFERFGPDAPPRDRFAYLPFGAGPRICIGMSFAEIEAGIMLGAVLRRARVRPGPARTVEPQLRVTMRPKGGMPLRVEPRGRT